MNPPDESWHVPPVGVPTPIPIAIVAGGPADVKSTVIWKPDEVTVNGLESLEPTCTVPEKFSVTSGEEGVVGSVRDVSSAELEQPAADNAVATIRQAKVRFTFTLLENVYVSEPWRRLDKSNAFTARISS
jgi:hypothetical protein